MNDDQRNRLLAAAQAWADAIDCDAEVPVPGERAVILYKTIRDVCPAGATEKCPVCDGGGLIYPEDIGWFACGVCDGTGKRPSSCFGCGAEPGCNIDCRHCKTFARYSTGRGP